MRLDLALVGFGNVGRRFARLLGERAAMLLRDHDLECRIVGIVTRRSGAAFNGEGIDGVRAADLVDAGGSLDPVQEVSTRRPADAQELIALAGRRTAATASARVVVETTTLNIEAGRPAIDHVEAALDNGCHVVTANKGPAAFAFQALQDRAAAARRSFLFEGAVMDGVPVFNLVRETMPAVEVLGFRGVVNSTTNHILTALEEGEAFGPALARMQALGIAEADASLDVDGWDAAAKAAVLANVLMGARVTPHDVRRTGIGEASAASALEAVRQGRRLKLVASAARGEAPVVEPMELAGDDLLAGLRGTANALILHTDLLGEIAICQRGGGLTQTAYALLSDLVTIRRRIAGGGQ
jgi:homoserine dehydrogenase